MNDFNFTQYLSNVVYTAASAIQSKSAPYASRRFKVSMIKTESLTSIEYPYCLCDWVVKIVSGKDEKLFCVKDGVSIEGITEEVFEWFSYLNMVEELQEGDDGMFEEEQYICGMVDDLIKPEDKVEIPFTTDKPF